MGTISQPYHIPWPFSEPYWANPTVYNDPHKMRSSVYITIADNDEYHLTNATTLLIDELTDTMHKRDTFNNRLSIEVIPDHPNNVNVSPDDFKDSRIPH